MGNNNVEIGHENLKKYWKTFFDEHYTENDIEKILLTISGKGYKELFEEYNIRDEQLMESIGWENANYSELLKVILEEMRNQDPWVFFYEPILNKYLNQLIKIIGECDLIHDKKTLTHMVIEQICNQLHLVTFQTIIAELYYAKQNGMLLGEDPVARGNYYSEIVLKNDDYRKEVHSDYPELTRIMDTKVKNTVKFIGKVLKDTETEIENIKNRLNNSKDIGKIVEINMGEGDTHNNGQTVTRIIFDSGKVIIYKPHNLELEEKYYEFIQWLNREMNACGGKLQMAAKAYGIADAGWMECIEYQACETEAEIESFYYKIGMLLCILHTTNGNDMHFENLIACKDMPVLIDLETFIHPDLLGGKREANSAMEQAVKEIHDSVMKIALLPTHLVSEKTGKMMDLGGMGANQEQEAPLPGKGIMNYRTDEVKVKFMHGTIKTKNNNPTIGGENADCKNYKEMVIEGFATMYKWVLNNKESYTEKLVELFNDSIIRVLYRATNVYAQVLNTSYHPDLLTNTVDREVYLHRIANQEVGNSWKRYKLEIRDMLNGEIPYFFAKASENNVYGVHSEELELENSIAESAIDTIKNKIKRMDENKFYRQLAIINTKLHKGTWSEKTDTALQKKVMRKYENYRLVEGAEIVGNYLLERSISGGEDKGKSRTWFIVEENKFGFNDYEPMDGSLYSGLAGLAMFYNYLAKITAKSKYEKATDEICRTLIEYIPRKEERKNGDYFNIGAFAGLAGIAYSLFHIDNSNGKKQYEKYITGIIDIIHSKVDDIKKLDVIGEVGIIGIIISIFEKTDNETLKEKILVICDKIFDKLYNERVESNDVPGVAWGKKMYVGYAHGNAGIVAMLYRYYNIVKKEEVLSLIEEALLFERAMYDENEKNWKRGIDEDYVSCAWCHGAPGILLSKLQMVRLGFRDGNVSNELKVAMDTTIEKGFKNDRCLCHGDMGNLSILKEAGIVLNNNELYLQAVCTIETLMEKLLEKMSTERFKQYEHNGFMLGLAGFGYELLRVNRENIMPNVLLLE